MGVGIFFDSDLHGSIYNSENILEDERANGLLGKWRWSHKHLKAAFNSGILHIVCAFTIYIGLLELEFMSIRIREACSLKGFIGQIELLDAYVGSLWVL